MSYFTRLGGTAIFASAITSSGAFADVTADDVWDTLSAYYASMGLTVTATTERDGATLKISDLKLTGDFPFDWGNIAITTTGITLTENDDGTVAFILPESLPIAMALTLPNDVFATANLTYGFTGYTAVASGEAGNVTLDYSADSAVLTLQDVAAPNTPNDTFEMSYSVQDFSGGTTFTTGDMFATAQTFSMNGMEIIARIRQPTNGNGNTDDSDMHFTAGKLSGKTETVIPANGIDLSNLPAALRAGMKIGYTATIENMDSLSVTTINDNIFMRQADHAQTSHSTVSFSESGVDIAATTTGRQITIDMPQQDLSIQVTADAMDADVHIPLLKADVEQPFDYSLNLGNFTLNDSIWNMFDPQQKLSRDPAQFHLDFSGVGKLFVDLLDFEAMPAVISGDKKLGELYSVSLNKFLLSAVNASLNASGAFTFNNDDLETFGGFPAPSGDINITAAGANGLIDTLIAMGILSDSDAMGARMAMGLFAVVGDEDDTLKSTITVTEEGHVLANGQRLK